MSTQERFSELSFAKDRAVYEKWTEEQRLGLSDVEETQLGEIISALMLFLADGYTSGKLTERAAAVLLLMRPDLVDRTYEEMASRLGVTSSALSSAMVVLRQELPYLAFGGFRLPTSSTKRRVSLADMRQKRREVFLVECGRRADRARKMISQASPLFRKAAQDMAAFDISLGLKPKPLFASQPVETEEQRRKITARLRAEARTR